MLESMLTGSPVAAPPDLLKRYPQELQGYARPMG
jgi:hypothetical protein